MMTERLRKLSAVAAVVLSGIAISEIRADDAAVKGAEVGEWTQDYEAALKLAKEKKLPVLLNFTGSDWCGWCKLMTRKVFQEKKWQAYAQKSLVLVTLDFPKDASLVPAEYVSRNGDLKAKFEVEGYPTYILLDDNGEDVLGQIGAEENPTPAGFIDQLEGLARYRAVAMQAYAATLPAEKGATYREKADRLQRVRTRIEELEEARTKADEELSELRRQVDQIHIDVRVAELGPAKGKQYRQLIADLAAIKKELADWLATQPQRTPENSKRYEDLKTKIGELKTQIAEM